MRARSRDHRPHRRLLGLALAATSCLTAVASPSAHGQSPDPGALEVARVQAVLRSDEIAIAFFPAEPHSIRWVMSHEHAVVDEVAGRAELEALAARLRDARHGAGDADIARTAAKLGELLFGGITTADDRPMVIVRGAPLEDVRFEALIVRGRPLGDRHRVSYAASLDEIVQTRATALRDAPVTQVPIALGLAAAAAVLMLAKLRKSG